MAVASIAVPPDPARDARARELLRLVATWPKHTLKVAWGSFEAGTVFRRATGSNGARYLVNAVACDGGDTVLCVLVAARQKIVAVVNSRYPEAEAHARQHIAAGFGDVQICGPECDDLQG